MKKVKYEQGMTKVWSDGEKVVITNPSSMQHVEENVDRIFGVGEYQKIYHVKYSHEESIARVNKHARENVIISGYIPQRVIDDLGEQSLPGNKGADLVEKYFK